MTREQARESAKEDRRMAEIKEAYADGAEIELRHSEEEWIKHNTYDFSDHSSNYRIKPKHPIRYWSKPEDVPVGRAVMRKRGYDYHALITVGGNGIYYGNGASWTAYTNLADYEHALIQPDGTLGPWLPCGKEEA